MPIDLSLQIYNGFSMSTWRNISVKQFYDDVYRDAAVTVLDNYKTTYIVNTCCFLLKMIS